MAKFQIKEQLKTAHTKKMLNNFISSYSFLGKNVEES